MFSNPWFAIVRVTIPVVGLYAASVGVNTAGPLNPWLGTVSVKSPVGASYIALVAVWSEELTSVILIDLPAKGSVLGRGYEWLVTLPSWAHVNLRA